MVAGGQAVDWLLKAVDGTINELTELTHLAARVPAGANGLIFLPYLAGELQPINDGFARGVFFGLTLQTAKAHLFRAVLEGTAFAIAHNLSLARRAGASAKQIFAVGGITGTKRFYGVQIICDVTGLPIHAMEDKGGGGFGRCDSGRTGSEVV